jgi:hypothetical protein
MQGVDPPRSTPPVIIETLDARIDVLSPIPRSKP